MHASCPRPSRRIRVTQLTAAFRLNLTAFSLLALVVGMFLVYNTTLFSVVQAAANPRHPPLRRRHGPRDLEPHSRRIGDLCSRRLCHRPWRSACCSDGSPSDSSPRRSNDLYFSVTVRDVQADPVSLAKGLVLGVATALAAAALPAAEAAGIPAITVLQRSDLESRVRRWLPHLTLGGIALFVAGALTVTFSQSVTLAFAGIFLGLLGITLAVPSLTVLADSVSQTATLGRRLLTARMAARTVTQSLSRTAVAIAALMVAVAVVIGVTIMIASFRSTVENWLDQTLTADVYVTSPIDVAGYAESMDPAIAGRLPAVPGIDRVELIRSAEVYSPDLGKRPDQCHHGRAPAGRAPSTVLPPATPRPSGRRSRTAP